jgi:uncharacterized membrane protein
LKEDLPVRKLLFFGIPFRASIEVPRRLAGSLAIALAVVILGVATASARSADGTVVSDSSASVGLAALSALRAAVTPSDRGLYQRFEGSGAGLAVMIGLVLALVYAMVVLVMALFGRTVRPGPSWINLAVPILCMIGLGVAGYLTFVEARQVAPVCGPVGDCNTVQSSPYSKLFGIVPVGLLGLLGYLAILSAWALGQLSKGKLSDLAAVAVFALALFGALFSIYLTYLELAVILAVCIWCLTSAVILAILLVLTTGPALVRLAPMEIPDS